MDEYIGPAPGAYSTVRTDRVCPNGSDSNHISHMGICLGGHP
ncbi:hypothetical protein BZL29_8158 [Mycobacterium kansasii]|uniref:Uncharacterized protein n=1 Tax=Mycobacterium kansasii TaxID=1768 RepID=A0A1V3WCL5_MYCKA|nr:hypothetical protein BZL29_8158 [Mycobacterium kansasii]